MGRGAGNILNESLGGPVESYTPLAALLGPEGKNFVYFFLGMNKKQPRCDEQGAAPAQRPVLRVYKPKKTAV